MARASIGRFLQEVRSLFLGLVPYMFQQVKRLLWGPACKKPYGEAIGAGFSLPP
jgi:hypothetical protein